MGRSWVHVTLKKYSYYDEDAGTWAVENAGLLMSIAIDPEGDDDAEDPNIILSVSKNESTLVNFNLRRIKRQFNSSFRHYKIVATSPSIGFKILSQKTARVDAFKFQVRMDDECYRKVVFLLKKCGCAVEGDTNKYESMEEMCFRKRTDHSDQRPRKKISIPSLADFSNVSAGSLNNDDLPNKSSCPIAEENTANCVKGNEDDEVLVVSQYLIPPTQPSDLSSSQGFRVVDSESSFRSSQVASSSQTTYIPDYWSQGSPRKLPSQPKKPIILPVEFSSSPTTAPLSPPGDDDTALEDTLLRLCKDSEFVSLVEKLDRAIRLLQGTGG